MPASTRAQRGARARGRSSAGASGRSGQGQAPWLDFPSAPEGDPHRAQDQGKVVGEHLQITDQARAQRVCDDLPHVDQVVLELVPVRDVPAGEDLRDPGQPRTYPLTQLIARHVADVHVLLDTPDPDALLFGLRPPSPQAHIAYEEGPEP